MFEKIKSIVFIVICFSFFIYAIYGLYSLSSYSQVDTIKKSMEFEGYIFDEKTQSFIKKSE